MRRHSRCPGTAPSRENANIIRDADVTEAVRQNSCATQQMKSSASAQFWLIDVCQMVITAFPTASSTGLSAPGIAKVTARRRIQPKTTDATTDMYMPTAAILEAFAVSSAMCADASKPVIVYWAISRPWPNTYQNMNAPKLWPEKPELLIVCPKTYPSDLCWSGTTISTSTMTATPIMCQYAETVFRSAVTLTRMRLSTTA